MEDRRLSSENMHDTIAFCLQECDELLDLILPNSNQNNFFTIILPTVFIENFLNIKHNYN
jgi:hypothetical protein